MQGRWLTGRAKGVEFPVKPIQPRWNESFYAMHEDDYNDILNSGMYYAPHQDPAEKEYEEAMEVYRTCRGGWCSSAGNALMHRG